MSARSEACEVRERGEVGEWDESTEPEEAYERDGEELRNAQCSHEVLDALDVLVVHRRQVCLDLALLDRMRLRQGL